MVAEIHDQYFVYQIGKIFRLLEQNFLTAIQYIISYNKIAQ